MTEKLSPHFTVAEFEFSQTATREGIKVRLRGEHKASAQDLCEKVLEPIRAYYDRPIFISSGYRPRELNALVKDASTTSQHCLGEAADITVIGVSQKKLFTDIVTGKIPWLVWDQVIDEFGAWVHISYRTGRNRKQKLKARRVRGRTVYTVLA